MSGLLVGFGTVALVTIAIYSTYQVKNNVRSHIDDERLKLHELAVRADWQHRQILSGDITNGTYGVYTPPKSLVFIHNLHQQKID